MIFNKKIYSLILVSLIALSAVPFAFAEDSEETKPMHFSMGAEVRLLQLEKAITRAILKAEVIIEAFENAEVDVTELERILGELEDLKTTVQSADPSSESAVEDFVSHKLRARELVKEFRDEIIEMKDELTDEELNELKDNLKDINDQNKSDLSQLKERIRNKIRRHNGKVVDEFLGIRGRVLKSRIQNGELNKEQIRERVRKLVSTMSNVERKRIVSEAAKLGRDNGGRNG